MTIKPRSSQTQFRALVLGDEMLCAVPREGAGRRCCHRVGFLRPPWGLAAKLTPNTIGMKEESYLGFFRLGKQVLLWVFHKGEVWEREFAESGRYLYLS